MDAAESAVRHQDDDVARSRLGCDGTDNVLHGGDMTRVASCLLEIPHELIGRQTLRLGQRRAEHAGNHHLVGSAEGPREIGLEDTPARRRRAWFEHRHEAPVCILEPQCGKRFAHRGRMMGKVINHGDAVNFAANLETATTKSTVAFEGRMKDGETKEVVALFADRESQKYSPVNVKDLTWYGHARSIIREWADQFVRMASKAPTEIIKDSPPFDLRCSPAAWTERSCTNRRCE